MSKPINKIISAYLVEQDYCDKEYLSQEEVDDIENIKRYIERVRYREEHSIYVDDQGKLFRLKEWDLSNQEIELLLKIDQNMTLDKIKKLLNSTLLFIIFLLVIICLRACSGY